MRLLLEVTKHHTMETGFESAVLITIGYHRIIYHLLLYLEMALEILY
jgi:hypothetical protein